MIDVMVRSPSLTKSSTLSPSRMRRRVRRPSLARAGMRRMLAISRRVPQRLRSKTSSSRSASQRRVVAHLPPWAKPRVRARQSGLWAASSTRLTSWYRPLNSGSGWSPSTLRVRRASSCQWASISRTGFWYSRPSRTVSSRGRVMRPNQRWRRGAPLQVSQFSIQATITRRPSGVSVVWGA